MNSNQARISRIAKSFHVVAIVSLVILLFGPLSIGNQIGSFVATILALNVLIFKSLNRIPLKAINNLSWIGDRSYSIYLVHMPFLYLAKFSPVTEIESFDQRIIQTLIAVIASIIVGALIYTKAESKFRDKQRIDHVSIKHTVVFATLTAGFVFTLFIGVASSTKFELANSGQPTPNKVLPWDWDVDCRFYSTPSKINRQPCKYGDFETDQSILLIGDSHAASISRAIISIGRSSQINTYVFTFEGCGFVLNREILNSSYSYPYLTSDCLQHNQSIVNFVQEKKPTVIIWAHRSSSIMISPNNDSSRYQYNIMIQKNLQILIGDRKNLINIGSGPELMPIETRFQDLLNSTSSYSKIPFEDNEFWEKDDVSNFYLDSLSIFCPGGKCINFAAGQWLFHDKDHLSEKGAEMLIPELTRAVEKFLD